MFYWNSPEMGEESTNKIRYGHSGNELICILQDYAHLFGIMG